MPIRKVDPKTGAISFTPTEEEQRELDKIRKINQLIERIEKLEQRVKELEERG